MAESHFQVAADKGSVEAVAISSHLPIHWELFEPLLKVGLKLLVTLIGLNVLDHALWLRHRAAPILGVNRLLAGLGNCFIGCAKVAEHDKYFLREVFVVFPPESVVIDVIEPILIEKGLLIGWDHLWSRDRRRNDLRFNLNRRLELIEHSLLAICRLRNRDWL